MREKYVEKVYKHLHSIPEKALCEFKTSEFIASELKTMGYSVKENFFETSVIAVKDSGNEGPALAVRADMDALEFEIGGKKVVNHACGHDTHSAMVLATAKAVVEKGIKRGKIVFVFQPAEEISKGAIGISKSGMLDDVTEMVGIHLRPIQEASLGEATPALSHGASKMISVKIKGTIAHGARPHLGVNAVDAAVLAVNAVNAIRGNPSIAHSVKVTNIQTEGTAHNVIPNVVYLKLDLRAQTNELMDSLTEGVKNAILTSVKSIGAEAEITYCDGVVAAEYDDNMISVAKEAIIEVLGKSLEPIVTPGGEDFHFYTQMLDIKTSYIGLGADLKPGLHDPEMTFNLKALEYGEKVLSKIVHKRLG
ncbi:amidohydrolase [Anaerovirgula multivorans]|uniref:Amidohydrolase n=1 Tax=Anaerovirgula multivorans TaxID=312168 RepID=A0A239GT07_9FIRM|nr:amidohydrolase [Anaerovirgula multivorans]SNS71204.1 amidohydrolase [Anaerovirgula multivorans]